MGASGGRTGGRGDLPMADWYSVRHVQSFKPKSYTCPLCLTQLHAMSDHVLITPEGDAERRRHAHSTCVRAARDQGLLPSREEWTRSRPRDGGAGGGLLGRLLGR